MSSPHHPSIKIEIATQADRPEILTGLEAWLQLGLIDDLQVRRLCRQHFTCPLPEVVTPPQPLEAVSPPPRSRPSKPVKPTVATAPKPSILAQMVQSLMAELSVRWLLFLGVFLVVVSSGVLAASQWERFPAVGQYGVLWGYTIVFWLISLWADRQANLRLTLPNPETSYPVTDSRQFLGDGYLWLVAVSLELGRDRDRLCESSRN
uniref:Uncharacterized protein n=1 Tax=Desertifilum tharense IPPAS B-1220 TaxID=1781255 RepID=A0ACD5GSV6_9CYAN